MNDSSVQSPLVVHVIYRLAIGGMENGLVNLINNMPQDRYRHAIVCIDDYTDFRDRIQRADVKVYALHKKSGHDFAVWWRFWVLLRKLKPAIVHTRNLGALEFQIPALLAGVPCRVQSEHGRDTTDLKGDNKKYLLLRRFLNPVVGRHIALSKDLQDWLVNKVRVNTQHISQIYNGVDTERFKPTVKKASLPVEKFSDDSSIVIGTIGRMQSEKDQLTLVRAFIILLDSVENGRNRLRLVLVGDGSLRAKAVELLQQANADNLAWLPGNRDDAPQVMQALDIFVLPSLIEGISNTILEAMATGLPVVATEVGGNSELVIDETGFTVPAADPAAMSKAIQRYTDNPELRKDHGMAGRQRVERLFSMPSMINGYLGVYDNICCRTASTTNLVSE